MTRYIYSVGRILIISKLLFGNAIELERLVGVNNLTLRRNSLPRVREGFGTTDTSGIRYL